MDFTVLFTDESFTVAGGTFIKKIVFKLQKPSKTSLFNIKEKQSKRNAFK